MSEFENKLEKVITEATINMIQVMQQFPFFLAVINKMDKFDPFDAILFAEKFSPTLNYSMELCNKYNISVENNNQEGDI